jgi:hypothetical protein
MGATVKAMASSNAKRVITKRDLEDGEAVLVTFVDGVIEFRTLSATDPAIASLVTVLADSENV